jgi:hypothetical protein
VGLTTETVFVTALLGGIALLVAALAVVRFNWRKDVPPFGRHSNSLDIAVHPDRYAVPKALPLIRTLSFLGGSLIAVAVATLVVELLRQFR